MTTLLDGEDASRFRAVSRRFLTIIDERRDVAPLEFLARVHTILPELYAAALALHEVEPDTSGEHESEVSHEGWQPLYNDIGALLGCWNSYSHVYDPYDESDREAIYGSVADDLAGIYLDLRRALVYEDVYGATHPNDTYWTWRFDFQSHWASHATRALRAIQVALFSHYASVLPESFESPPSSKPDAS